MVDDELQRVAEFVARTPRRLVCTEAAGDEPQQAEDDEPVAANAVRRTGSKLRSTSAKKRARAGAQAMSTSAWSRVSSASANVARTNAWLRSVGRSSAEALAHANNVTIGTNTVSLISSPSTRAQESSA